MRTKKQERNKKNLKQRLKKQAEHAVTMEALKELTPLQRLQWLINKLEEYVSSRLSRAIPLDEYIPGEEMEGKTRLKSWLQQMV